MINGYVIHHYPKVGSTNSVLQEMALAGSLHGTVVRADVQEAGRGRDGRVWVSELGNLFFSTLLVPPAHVISTQIAYIAAIAVGEALIELFSDKDLIKISYKWPNDILIGYKKISGILLEAGFSKKRKWIIIGIGVNVNSSPPYATSLHSCVKNSYTISNCELLRHILMRIDGLYNLWLCSGFGSIRKLWMDRAFGLGSKISYSGKTGIFQGIDKNGNAIIRQGNVIAPINSGKLFFGTGPRVPNAN